MHSRGRCIVSPESMHRWSQCIARPVQDCRSLYMGLAGLLKAVMAECIYLFIGETYINL